MLQFATMMQEFDSALMKEALAMEKPILNWGMIHGSRTPIAEIDLRKYRFGYDRLKFSPIQSDEADFASDPLKKTWPNQFNRNYPNKWFEGDKFLDFYKMHPSVYKGMPAARNPMVPFVGFLIGGSLESDQDRTPAVARILTLDETIPEKVHGLGLATTPSFRRIGLASKFVEYSFLLLDHFKVADRIEWDTNTLGSQVSGGWSPTPLWSKYGTEYGRMAHYGTTSESTGDGAFYFANINQAATALSKAISWSEYSSLLGGRD